MSKPRVTIDPPITGGVVLGHDGSPQADWALRWAVQEARVHGYELHVVRAWVLSTAIRDTGVPFGTIPSWEECQRAVAGQLSATVADADAGDLTVTQHPVHGPSAQVLMAAAEHAEMLVVGKRGGGGFAGLHLGSVAEQVSRHARCTVVIVR